MVQIDYTQTLKHRLAVLSYFYGGEGDADTSRDQYSSQMAYAPC